MYLHVHHQQGSLMILLDVDMVQSTQLDSYLQPQVGQFLVTANIIQSIHNLDINYNGLNSIFTISGYYTLLDIVIKPSTVGYLMYVS
jgi:hypothetical protein